MFIENKHHRLKVQGVREKEKKTTFFCCLVFYTSLVLFLRQVKYTGAMDRRNRIYPPLLGHFRSYHFRNKRQMQDMRKSMMLWGARVGSLFCVSYGIESVCCVLTRRPYGTSTPICFFSGLAAGWVFTMSGNNGNKNICSSFFST